MLVKKFRSRDRNVISAQKAFLCQASLMEYVAFIHPTVFSLSLSDNIECVKVKLFDIGTFCFCAEALKTLSFNFLFFTVEHTF